MLDQSFSSKSFQEIFDNENRKGMNVEKKFNNIFSDSIDKVASLKQLRKRIQEETNLDTKKVLYENKKALKQERDALVTGVLDE